MKINNTAFVVLSCDNYSDLWPLFIESFNKFWPDCPFDKYFTSNFKEIPKSSFSLIKIGKDESWSDGVIKVLEELKNKYEFVLITLEDSVLISKVNNDDFLKIFHSFEINRGNYLKFIKKPKPTNYLNQYFGVIEAGSLYRPTCVYSLWKISVFRDLLKKCENAWEFERYGAIRSDVYDNFYVVNSNFFQISNTIVRGYWVPSELNRLKKIGIEPEVSRPLLSKIDSVKLSFKVFVFSLFNFLIPWRWRRNIIFKLKKLC